MDDASARKLLNIDLIKKLGWRTQIKLTDGLNLSYHDILSRNSHLNKAPLKIILFLNKDEQ